MHIWPLVWRSTPLHCKKKKRKETKKKITAVATREILPGCLRIPVFCIRDSSYMFDVVKNANKRSPHDVVGKIKWKQPVNESNEREVEICCFCQPERRLPSGNKKVLDSYRDEDCHPFWHIRRSLCVGEFNSAVVEVEIKVITSSPMKQLKTDDYHPTSGCWDFEVTVPCIVNTERIAGGAEIVVEWNEIGNMNRLIGKRVGCTLMAEAKKKQKQ